MRWATEPGSSHLDENVERLCPEASRFPRAILSAKRVALGGTLSLLSADPIHRQNPVAFGSLLNE